MKSEKYEALELIGHGSFSIVRKVRRKSDGKVFARKEIQLTGKKSANEQEQIKQEIENHSKISHRNIVRYLENEFDCNSKILYIYMDYCGKGDLAQLIEKCRANRSRLNEQLIWNIFSQTVLALYICHTGTCPPKATLYGHPYRYTPKNFERVLLHRDIKPDNNDDNLIKLGDFGLSKCLTDKRKFARTYVGTPYYMSPEIVNKEGYTTKSDIWSLGCVMYELCMLAPPFEASEQKELEQKIMSGSIPRINPAYSEELANAIKSCLHVKPRKRPSADMLLEIPAINLMRVQQDMELWEKSLQDKESELLAYKEDLAKKAKEITRREMTLNNLELILKREREQQRKFQEEFAKKTESMQSEIMQRDELIQDSPMQISPVIERDYANSNCISKFKEVFTSSTPHKLSSLAIKSMSDLRSPLRERNAMADEKLSFENKTPKTPASKLVASGKKFNLGSPSRQLRKQSSNASIDSKTSGGFFTSAKSLSFFNIVQRKRFSVKTTVESKIDTVDPQMWVNEETLPSPFLRTRNGPHTRQ